MGSPQNAAARHRLNSIRAIIQSYEADLRTASPFSRADLELLISFFKDAEKNAMNEIELQELMHGEIERLMEAYAHPERYITNAPAPPSPVGRWGSPRGPRPTREERIERKKADLGLKLQKAEARSSELRKAIQDWYLLALPEWDKVTANARARSGNSQGPLMDALKSASHLKKPQAKGALKPIPARTRRRRQIIFGAIQSKLKGAKYCAHLDANGLRLPPDWIEQGCPSSYASAYRSPKWRPKIHDEKYRFGKHYEATSPRQREEIIQGSSGARRTRQDE